MDDSHYGLKSSTTSLEARVNGKRDRKSRPQQPRKMRPWLIVASLLAFVWAFLSMLNVQPPQATGMAGGGDTLYLIGFLAGATLSYTLIISGILGLILYLAAGRRLTPGKGFRNFRILWVSALVGALPVVTIAIFGLASAASTRQQVDVIVGEYRARAAEVTKAPGVQARIARNNADLSLVAIVSPGGMDRARKAIADQTELQQSMETRITALESTTKAKLLATPVSGPMREVLVKEIEHGEEISSRSFILMREGLRLQSKRLSLLAHQPQTWRMEGEILLFDSDSDLSEFNAMTQELQAISDELIHLQNATAAQSGPL